MSLWLFFPHAFPDHCQVCVYQCRNPSYSSLSYPMYDQGCHQLATGVLQNIYPSYVRLRVRVMSALGSLSGHCPTERCNQRCHRFGSSCPSFSSLSLVGTDSVLLYGVLSFSYGDSFLLKWVAISSPVMLIFMTVCWQLCVMQQQ